MIALPYKWDHALNVAYPLKIPSCECCLSSFVGIQADTNLAALINEEKNKNIKKFVLLDSNFVSINCWYYMLEDLNICVSSLGWVGWMWDLTNIFGGKRVNEKLCFLLSNHLSKLGSASLDLIKLNSQNCKVEERQHGNKYVWLDILQRYAYFYAQTFE